VSASLAQVEAAGLVAAADAQLARALGRRVAEPAAEVLLAAALASRQVAAGHVCLELGRLPEPGLRDPEAPPLEWPEPARWCEQLAASPLVGGPATEPPRPLVLADDRLYLRRYWDYEGRLVAAVRARAEAAPVRGPASPAPGPGRAAPQLAFDFDAPPEPGGVAGEPDGDLQELAVRMAASRRLGIVSGGPGTGKTWIVARLLVDAIERALAAGRPAPRCLLLAPTGKAAARLLESLGAAGDAIAPAAAVRAALPEAASTVHRALGLGSDRRRAPRHGPGRPLPADLVVVDEASMVDLALMTRLLEAVAPAARLVLLGDPDQLASVEAGAVLGDLCRAADAGAPALRGGVVRLRESRRYEAASGVGRLAEAVRAGDAERALSLLDDASVSDAARIDPGDGRRLPPELVAGALEGYAGLRSADGVADAVDGYRVLCAVRRGPLGVEAANRALARALFGAELDLDRPPPGLLLMITRNEPELALYNGDTGVVARHADGTPQLALAAGGAARRIALARLPEHEPVLAMSVHKSQGSELDRVDLVLPTVSSPLCTRELVYTAITRARRSVRIFASRAILAEAIGRRVHRSSGLVARLGDGS